MMKPLLLLLSLWALYAEARAAVFSYQSFPSQPLRAFERTCPCEKPELCLPISFGANATPPGKKEVFAFSVTTSDQWKLYDWDQVRLTESVRLGLRCVYNINAADGRLIWCVCVYS